MSRADVSGADSTANFRSFIFRSFVSAAAPTHPWSCSASLLSAQWVVLRRAYFISRVCFSEEYGA